jgi:hypothetical protein
VRIPKLLFAIVLAPAAAAAGELELTGYIGSVFPFYEQSFEFDPGSLPGLPPGISVEQEDIFHLDGKGGLALGAGASWQFAPWLGIEGRMDTADVSVQITGARYTLTVDLPGPIPDLTNELVLGGGDADLHRLHPVSLNLRARTSGRTRVGASAGVSYLPSFDFVTVQSASFKPVSPLPLPGAEATVTLEAKALPDEEDEGRLGWNGGIFVQVGIGERLALVGEARYFHFGRQTLTWGVPEIEPSLPVLGEALVEAVAGQLEPVDFNPTFFQATVGLTVRF